MQYPAKMKIHLNKIIHVHNKQLSEVGGVNRSGADAPHRESKPGADAHATHVTHPHRTHDTTDQWRDPCFVVRMVFKKMFSVVAARVQRPI